MLKSTNKVKSIKQSLNGNQEYLQNIQTKISDYRKKKEYDLDIRIVNNIGIIELSPSNKELEHEIMEQLFKGGITTTDSFNIKFTI